MTVFGTLEAIVASHRAIRRFVAMADSADEGEVLGQLAWLRSGLPRHFALEEQPGGFLEAVEARPGMARVGRELREEHRALHAELVAIDAASGRGEAVVERLRAFARALGAHEAREAALGLEMDDPALPRR